MSIKEKQCDINQSYELFSDSLDQDLNSARVFLVDSLDEQSSLPEEYLSSTPLPICEIELTGDNDFDRAYQTPQKNLSNNNELFIEEEDDEIPCNPEFSQSLKLIPSLSDPNN